jgi:hypothetical protein
MRQFAAVTLCLAFALAAAGGDVVNAPEKGAAVIRLADGTEIHVYGSDELKFSAETISHDHAAGRVELRGMVQLTVSRGGAKIIEVKTKHAVIERPVPAAG